jgi:23S rRNA pseudouridine1911/1915/1917 synthase
MIRSNRIGQTLQVVIKDLFPDASKSNVKKWILQGRVKVNSKIVRQVQYIVKPDDKIEYSKSAFPDKIKKYPFHVFFEDRYLIIVEKSSGLLTYGEKESGGTSLYKIMSDFLKDQEHGREQLYVVHRLDREVSGIVLFAKTEKIQKKLKDQWRQTCKRYFALVEGEVRQREGTVHNWLIEGNNLKVYSTSKREGAKMAITHFRVKEIREGNTLLDVELETGRKHQIRVHLSGMGHPIIGDYRYGANNRIKRRIRLHAYYFSFYHPITKQFMEFTSSMPRGFLVLGAEDEKYK